VGNASSGPASAVALADCGETLKHRFLIEVHFYQRVEFELDCWRSKVRRGPEPIKTAMIAGTTIECADHGEGEPLLLVHAGVFADWFVPSPKARRLLVCALSECAERAMGQTRPHLTSPSRTTRAIWQVLPISWSSTPCTSLVTRLVALIAFQMAIDRPTLVHSLMLIEPAACGPFQVPVFADLGERFVGPAMGAFAAGDLERAFDTFMRGVCGDRSREIIERTLGARGTSKQSGNRASFSGTKCRRVCNGNSCQRRSRSGSPC
jgi:pimeloyl-ACP methyl ester carboxylesterase